jgi:pseudaminic acid synthase
MNKKIKIGNFDIAENMPAFIIGELSANHNQSFDLAIKTIDEMHSSGVNCLKLQTVKPESITLDSNLEHFLIKGNTLWDNRTLYDLYKEVYTPWEWHEPLKKYAESKGMIFFSSPFDFQAVDFLESLDVPAYKIASFEITDIPLIKYVASKGKPVIISTGIADHEYIKDAIDACLSVNNKDVILLKCTSSYPTLLNEVNLKAILHLKNSYDCLVGLSDHTIGSLVPIGARALGACVIEKHFILDRSIGGPDSEFSSNPAEFSEMISKIRDLEEALGTDELILSPKMLQSRKFQRSLFVTEDIKKGELFTNLNIRSIRPGIGLLPKNFETVLGKKATADIQKGTPLSFDLIQLS